MAQRQVVYKKALGERIKRLAAKRNIPLSRLESQVGYSLGMFTRWTNAEDDENFEIFSKLAKIAGILGVTVDELLGLGESKEDNSRAGRADLISCILDSTEAKKLQWMEIDWKIVEELPTKPFLEPEERTPTGAWSVERGRLRFVLVAYCDDLDDEDEPMGLRMYALAGHGIPPQPIQAETTALQALYMMIQLQAAYQSLVDDTME